MVFWSIAFLKKNLWGYIDSTAQELSICLFKEGAA